MSLFVCFFVCLFLCLFVSLFVVKGSFAYSFLQFIYSLRVYSLFTVCVFTVLFTVHLFTVHSKPLSIQSLDWQDDQHAEWCSCGATVDNIRYLPYGKFERSRIPVSKNARSPDRDSKWETPGYKAAAPLTASRVISSFLGGANKIYALLGFTDVSRQPIRPETSRQNYKSVVYTTPEERRARNVLTLYSTYLHHLISRH